MRRQPDRLTAHGQLPALGVGQFRVTATSSTSAFSRTATCSPASGGSPTSSTSAACVASASSSAARRSRYSVRIRRTWAARRPSAMKRASTSCIRPGAYRSVAVFGAVRRATSSRGVTTKPMRRPGASILLNVPK